MKSLDQLRHKAGLRIAEAILADVSLVREIKREASDKPWPEHLGQIAARIANAIERKTVALNSSLTPESTSLEEEPSALAWTPWRVAAYPDGSGAEIQCGSETLLIMRDKNKANIVALLHNKEMERVFKP